MTISTVRSQSHLAHPILELVEQAIELQSLLVAEGVEGVGVESIDRRLHILPGGGALRCQPKAAAASVFGVLDALHPAAFLQPIKQGRDVLAGDHQEFYEILDRHTAATVERPCKGAHDGPLLGGRREVGHIARADLMQQVGRLIRSSRCASLPFFFAKLIPTPCGNMYQCIDEYWIAPVVPNR